MMTEDLMEQIIGLLGTEVQQFRSDFDSLEGRVQTVTRRIGQALLQRTVEANTNGYAGSTQACGCGHRQAFKGYRSRTVLTLFGVVTIRRGYYRCAACGASSVPYDRASGLGGVGLSNRLASAVSLLAVDISFQKACEKIERLLGVKVDDNAAVKSVTGAGAVLLARQQEGIEQFQADGRLAEPTASPKRLYVSSDGAMAPIRPSGDGVEAAARGRRDRRVDGSSGEGTDTIAWREVKCAAAWWEEGSGEAPIRRQRYQGRIEPAERFGWTWWLLAAGCGLRGAWEVVVLGDGALWIWNLAARFFGGAIQILDWYHAMEHVWACAAALYGEGAAGSKRWAKSMETVLWEAGGAALLRRLRRFQRRRREPCEALEDLIGYVEPNVARMDYPSYRSAGLHVGSGPIESACKQLVTARLKQSGMRWTVAGAEQTLALRCCWLNGDWDAFWQSKPLAA